MTVLACVLAVGLVVSLWLSHRALDAKDQRHTAAVSHLLTRIQDPPAGVAMGLATAEDDEPLFVPERSEYDEYAGERPMPLEMDETLR